MMHLRTLRLIGYSLNKFNPGVELKMYAETEVSLTWLLNIKLELEKESYFKLS